MDNLESQTYEVFEKDPIKYSQYQQVRAGTQPLLGLGGVLRVLLLEQDKSNYVFANRRKSFLLVILVLTLRLSRICGEQRGNVWLLFASAGRAQMSS